MRGGENLLSPALYGESDGGREDSGDDEREDDAPAPVNVGMFEDRHTDGHKDGGGADLQERELLEAHARREVRESDDVAGESESAGEREHIAEIDGVEVEARARGNGKEDDSDEGKQSTNKGVPARGARACGAQGWNSDEKRHEDNGHAGDEGGLGWSGEAEAGRLELVSGGKKEAGDGSAEQCTAADVSDVLAINDAEADGGERHTEQIEEQRRSVSEGAFDQNEGRAPDENDCKQKQMRLRGAGHGERVAAPAMEAPGGIPNFNRLGKRY